MANEQELNENNSKNVIGHSTKLNKSNDLLVSQEPQIMEGQLCPICNKNTLTLMEAEMEIPFFGLAYLFSMNCSDCGYHKADVEFDNKQDPCKYDLEVSCEEDLKIRIIKSSHANVKLGRIATIESNEAANGYITNVEGIIKRIEKIIEFARDNAEEKSERKTAKNHLKKIRNVLCGDDKIKLTITDSSGNSAIISDKAVKSKVKK
jgi:zinc finger protein